MLSIKYLMILAIVIVFAFYWLVSSLTAYYLLNKVFQKYRNYVKVETSPEWEGFKRQDFGKWDQKAIKKGCFTRFPINLLAMGSFLITLGFLGNLHKYLNFPRFLIELFRRHVGLWVCHFTLCIIQDYDASEEISTPIVISNHVNWLDLPFFGTCFRLLSFVAKKQVKKVPIINACAQYCKSIFVDREAARGRHQIVEQIAKRVREFQANPQKTFPIIIYPEGTVSNGRSVLQFKNGAFEPLCPITILSLRYECKQCHLGMDQITTSELTLLAFSLRPTLRLRKTIVAPLENESVQEYRERCRSKLAEMGGFKTYNANFKNVLEFEAMKKQASRKQKQSKIKKID